MSKGLNESEKASTNGRDESFLPSIFFGEKYEKKMGGRDGEKRENIGCPSHNDGKEEENNHPREFYFVRLDVNKPVTHKRIRGAFFSLVDSACNSKKEENQNRGKNPVAAE